MAMAIDPPTAAVSGVEVAWATHCIDTASWLDLKYSVDNNIINNDFTILGQEWSGYILEGENLYLISRITFGKPVRPAMIYTPTPKRWRHNLKDTIYLNSIVDLMGTLHNYNTLDVNGTLNLNSAYI